MKNYICFYPRYKQSPKNLKIQETLKENMRREFKEGTPTEEELRRSIGHLADVVFRSNRYEE